MRAQGVNGTFTLTAAGLYGSVSATIALDAPSLAIGGSVALAVNTTATAQGAIQPGVVATVTAPTLTVGGQSLSADSLVVRRSGTEVAIAVTNLALTLGSVVTVTATNQVSGTLVVTAGGVAGSFSVGSLAGAVTIPGLTLSGSVTVLLNTGTAAVARPELGLDVPAGPFLRVAVADGDLAVTGGPTFHGSFTLEQYAAGGVSSANPGVTVIGFTDVSVSLTPTTGGSGTAVGISQGRGAFVILASGVAGTFSGVVAVTGGSFSAGAQASVRYNATGGAVSQSVVVGGVTLPITFTAAESTSGGTWVSVAVSGVLTIGSSVEIAGTFTHADAGSSVSGLTVFVGQGPYFTPDAAHVSALARGLLLSNVSGWAQGSGATLAFSITGTLSLIGFDGVTLTGTATVFYNANAAAVTVSGAAIPGAGTSAYLRVIGTLQLGVAGQTLVGSIGVETTTGGGLSVTLGTAAGLNATSTTTPVTLDLGDGAVTATIGSGTFLLTPAGTAASLTLTSLAFTATTGFSFSTSGVLQLNTAAVDRVVDGVTLPARLGPRRPRHHGDPRHPHHRRPVAHRRLRLLAGDEPAASAAAGAAANRHRRHAHRIHRRHRRPAHPRWGRLRRQRDPGVRPVRRHRRGRRRAPHRQGRGDACRAAPRASVAPSPSPSTPRTRPSTPRSHSTPGR